MFSGKKKYLSGIKGVLFDVDGTLYHQGPVRFVMCCWLATRVLRPFKLYRILKIIYIYRLAQEELRDSGNDAVGNVSQIDLTVIKTGEPRSYVEKIVREWFEGKPLLLIKFFRRRGLPVVLSCLQERGVRLGVFSDYPVHAKLQALGLNSFFPVVVSASDKEVSGFKPYSNGFELAALKMGLRPDEVIYVGDRVKVDGIGAGAAGMTPAVIGSFRYGSCAGCIFIRRMREICDLAGKCSGVDGR